MEANSRAAAALNAVVLALRNDGGVARLRSACSAYRNDNRLLEMAALEMLLNMTLEQHQERAQTSVRPAPDVGYIHRMLQTLSPNLFAKPASAKHDEAALASWAARVSRNRAALRETARVIYFYFSFAARETREMSLAAAHVLVERFGYQPEYEKLLKTVRMSLPTNIEPMQRFVELCVTQGAPFRYFSECISRDTPLEVVQRLLGLPRGFSVEERLTLLQMAVTYKNLAVADWLLQELASQEDAAVIQELKGEGETLLITALTFCPAMVGILVDCPLIQGTYLALDTCIKCGVPADASREFMRLLDEGRLPLTEEQYWRAFDRLREHPNDVIMNSLLEDDLMSLGGLYQHLMWSMTLVRPEHVRKLITRVPEVLDFDVDAMFDLLVKAVRCDNVQTVVCLLSHKVVANPFMRRCALFKVAASVHRGTEVLQLLLKLSTVAVEYLEEQSAQAALDSTPESDFESAAKRARLDDSFPADTHTDTDLRVGSLLWERVRMFASSLTEITDNNLLQCRDISRGAIDLLLALPPTHPLCPLTHRHAFLGKTMHDADLTKRVLDSAHDWPPAVLAQAALDHVKLLDAWEFLAYGDAHAGFAYLLTRFPMALRQDQVHQPLMDAVDLHDHVLIQVLLAHTVRAFPGAATAGAHDQAALRRAVNLGSGGAVRALLAYGEADGVRVLPDILQHARVSCLPSVYQALVDASE